MKYTYNGKYHDRARELRNNMTDEERRLWYKCLNQLPVRVFRQRIIGNYVVDFYCPKKKIVIEVDGSQHYEDAGLASDAERDAYLNSLGITVIRYNNHEINTNFKGVCEDIYIKFGLI